MRCKTTRRGVLALFVFAAALPASAQTVPAGFSITDVNTNLDGDAVAFALLPDGRVIVANQFSGTLDLIVNGVLTSDLATVPNLNAGGERGLLAVAMDPAWPDSNYLYVYYTMGDNYSRAFRYPVTGSLSDGNSTNLVVSVASADTLLEMVDDASNHNGGTLRFGSDRSLYVSLGDDTDRDSVQVLTRLHGKIVRISPDPGQALPSPNPEFPSAPPDALDEIFAIGLRNPFRFNIDPKTDRLLIGDVGQNAFEEIDLSSGGENFGWPRWEANSLFSDSYSTIPPDPTFPIYAYSHVSGQNAVIALLTYRQKDFPSDASFPQEYEGAHFFAEFYRGPIFALRPDTEGGWAADTFATGFNAPVDATLLDDGSIYILEYGAALRQISYDPGPIVTLESEVFLEGPYLAAGVMDTTLLAAELVPPVQPYADTTYDGTFLELDLPVALDTIPGGVVDWIQAELRTGTSAGTEVASQVGFVRYDGALLDVNGTPGIVFPMADSTSYYVVVRHRNHASVMSADPVDFSSGVGSWDFTTASTQAYSEGGQPMTDLGGRRFGMVAGDANTDGQFTATDFNEWLAKTKAVATGYLKVDFDLDGQTLVSDFNLWLVNTKAVYTSQVPE